MLGACKRCGEIVWEVIEAKEDGTPRKIGRMLETGTQVDFLLSDGSEVSLTLCRPCADALTPEDYQPLWARIIEAADPTHPGGAPYLAMRFPVARLRRRYSPEPGKVVIDPR